MSRNTHVVSKIKKIHLLGERSKLRKIRPFLYTFQNLVIYETKMLFLSFTLLTELVKLSQFAQLSGAKMCRNVSSLTKENLY